MITENTPKYYRILDTKYDIFDLAEHLDMSFTLGCVLKYITRAGKKDGNSYKKDLEKALDCLQREIDKYKEKTKPLHERVLIKTCKYCKNDFAYDKKLTARPHCKAGISSELIKDILENVKNCAFSKELQKNLDSVVNDFVCARCGSKALYGENGKMLCAFCKAEYPA